MTRAEINEALATFISAAAWAERAVEALKAEAERSERPRDARAADLLSVHLTRIREGRESAARVLGMVGEE
jgi:hypothetical protein